MSRKAAILVLVAMALAIGLGVAISYIPYTYIDPESMPVCVLKYEDPDGKDKKESLNVSGYNWEMKDPISGAGVWETVGPNNFFTEKFGIEEILPGDLNVHLQILWLEPPDKIKIKRWPLSEWTPDDLEAIHSEGMDVARSEETNGKTTDVGFGVVRGSIYGVWVYYGDAWMEYSIIVPDEDPTSYDYLGYFGGFETPKADQFTMDPIEWIDMSNAQRIEELNLNVEDDFPSGFYIYNPTKEAIPLRLTDQTKYIIIDPKNGNTSITVDRDGFLNHLNQSPSFAETTPFWISETDGNVKFIKEQYVP